MMKLANYLLPAIVALPLVGCSDGVSPSWSDDASAEVSIDENDLVVAWPDATDDKGVSTYRVMVDGELGVEANAEARNWKSKNLPLGEDHEIAVTAIDAAGNESAPLKVSWSAKDVVAPTWPVGAMLKVTAAEAPAEGAEAPGPTDEQSLELTWPEAQDETAISFYRVVLIPAAGDKKNLRPKLVGVVKEGQTLETKGLANSRYEVYAVDTGDNASKPLQGALNNPTRFNPLRKLDANLINKEKVEPEAPELGKMTAEEAAKRAGAK